MNDYEGLPDNDEFKPRLYANGACLVGDTRISLLDGTCPTIAELAFQKEILADFIGSDNMVLPPPMLISTPASLIFYIRPYQKSNGSRNPDYASKHGSTHSNIYVTLFERSQFKPNKSPR